MKLDGTKDLGRRMAIGYRRAAKRWGTEPKVYGQKPTPSRLREITQPDDHPEPPPSAA